MLNDNLCVDDTQVREDLKNLLQFVEQLLARRDKVVFDITEYPIRITEKDLLGGDGAPLPGIVFGRSEDVWLSFDRLQERRPPAPSAQLQPWMRHEPRPMPNKPPSLLAERILHVTAEEATDLIEAGLADRGTVALLEDKDTATGTWAVALRPGELPAITEALASYTEGAWRTWATDEAPRRQTIRLYEALYKAHAQIAATGGEGGQELVVGIGLARWLQDGRRINMPVIEQRAEFELNHSNGTLTILPRNVPPAPVLRPFLELGISDAAHLQRDMATKLEQIAKDPDIAFGPFQPSSFRGVLETCAARLDASGVVVAPDEELGPAGDGLRISPSFCIIVRPRRDDILRDDMRRLADLLARSETTLPETARRFVLPPPDVPVDDDDEPIGPGIDFPVRVGGAGGVDNGDDDRGKKRRDWLFFPLPANEDQEEIARRLDQADVTGVVVQGPPGTGKTHTIANIIGHSMARGRRVLVAAHTGEALGAIRDKLPPALRGLTIAVTHSDREGARQLEEAVAALADRTQSINQREAKQRVNDLLRSIDEADTRLTEIGASLEAVARANLSKVRWRGGDALPHVIATWAAGQGERHAWFPDRLDLTPEYEPRFDEADIAEIRELRRRLGEDIAYRAEHLPTGSEALPGLANVVAAHRLLRGQEERRERERDGTLPRIDFSAAKPGEVADMLAWLERLEEWRNTCPDHPWMVAAWERMAAGHLPERHGGEALRPLLDEAADLAARGETLALSALELSDVADGDRLGDALGRLASGRSAFGFFGGLGRNPVKEAIDSARVAAERPGDAAAWTKLLQLHAWHRETRGFVARWNAFAAQHALTRLSGDQASARDGVRRLGRSVSHMLALMAEAQLRLERLRLLFPYGLETAAVVFRMDVSLAVASLRANMGDAEIAEAERLRELLRETGERTGNLLGDALLQVADSLGSRQIEDAAAADAWREISG